MDDRITEYDEREVNTDLRLKDFRPMNLEVTDDDVEDAFRGDRPEYEKSMRHEEEIYQAIEEEKRRQYQKAQERAERQDVMVSAFIYFIPVFFVLMCFFIDASSGFYLFIKFIFAIDGGLCVVKIADDFRRLNGLKKLSYIGLTIIGIIGISGIVGARYDRELWLFIDALYCMLKVLAFLGGRIG